jgi:hypothetical protein
MFHRSRSPNPKNATENAISLMAAKFQNLTSLIMAMRPVKTEAEVRPDITALDPRDPRPMGDGKQRTWGCFNLNEPRAFCLAEKCHRADIFFRPAGPPFVFVSTAHPRAGGSDVRCDNSCVVKTRRCETRAFPGLVFFGQERRPKMRPSPLCSQSPFCHLVCVCAL